MHINSSISLSSALNWKLCIMNDVHLAHKFLLRARAVHRAPAKPKSSTSKIKAPSSTLFRNASDHPNMKHLLENPMEAALSRRENAYRELVDGVKKEYEEVRREMTDLGKYPSLCSI